LGLNRFEIETDHKDKNLDVSNFFSLDVLQR